MIKRAALAFLITFCAPWMVASAFQTYSAAGSKVGEWFYEVTHEDVNL